MCHGTQRRRARRRTTAAREDRAAHALSSSSNAGTSAPCLLSSAVSHSRTAARPVVSRLALAAPCDLVAATDPRPLSTPRSPSVNDIVVRVCRCHSHHMNTARHWNTSADMPASECCKVELRGRANRARNFISSHFVICNCKFWPREQPQHTHSCACNRARVTRAALALAYTTPSLLHDLVTSHTRAVAQGAAAVGAPVVLQGAVPSAAARRVRTMRHVALRRLA